jgi:hypothetical protein
MAKVRVGAKICPKKGSYKDQTLTVWRISKIKRGDRQLGTRTGAMAYFAGPHEYADVYYLRSDFRVGPCKR